MANYHPLHTYLCWLLQEAGSNEIHEPLGITPSGHVAKGHSDSASGSPIDHIHTVPTLVSLLGNEIHSLMSTPPPLLVHYSLTSTPPPLLVHYILPHLQMLSYLLRVEPQILHASSCVAETACSQVDVVDTRQLLHLVVAYHLTIRSQEVKGHNGTLLKGVVKISPTVKHTRFVSIPMFGLGQEFVHCPEGHDKSHDHMTHAHACTCTYLAK